jgi:hypothetical protein
VDAIVRSRGNIELERDLVRALYLRLGVQVELNVETRLDLPGIDLRSAWIFDREILHILREDRNLRLAVVVGAIAAGTGFLVRH